MRHPEDRAAGCPACGKLAGDADQEVPTQLLTVRAHDSSHAARFRWQIRHDSGAGGDDHQAFILTTLMPARANSSAAESFLIPS